MDPSQIVDQLDRIEHWLSTIAKLQLAPVIDAELSNSRMSKLYELTGTCPKNEIAKKIKCSGTTISESWKRWERLGILVKEGNRYRKVFG